MGHIAAYMYVYALEVHNCYMYTYMLCTWNCFSPSNNSHATAVMFTGLEHFFTPCTNFVNVDYKVHVYMYTQAGKRGLRELERERERERR